MSVHVQHKSVSDVMEYLDKQIQMIECPKKLRNKTFYAQYHNIPLNRLCP